MSTTESPRQSGLLVKIETDRRLGHEWDEWDGAPLPNEGDFRTGAGRYFLFTTVGIVGTALVLVLAVFLLAPRLAQLSERLPATLYLAIAGVAAVALLWLALIGVAHATGRAILPERLAERGPFLKTMYLAARVGEIFGVRRDWTGHASVVVFDRLAWARSRKVTANELLILIPRCLSRAALDGVLEIAKRYDVAAFVATRGQLARRVIRERRPRAVVAVACERDMVSGLHDVAGKIPVLGLTMTLPNGPCKDAALDLAKMEEFVRKFVA